MQKSVLRRASVISRTGLSRSSIYLKMAQGQFPQSIRLGQRAVGWLESDVDAWITGRIEEARRPEA